MKSNTHIYCIPGLGYDRRIFQHLDLNDYTTIFLDWIDPRPNENISTYAHRFFKDYADSDHEMIIIGHSFGGMMAQEIAARFNIKGIILLSSIRSREEMPISFKLVRSFRLHGLFTKQIALNTVSLWGKDHGFYSADDIQLFKSMVSNYSNAYLQWALKSLAQWQGVALTKNTQIVQIHGTADKTFPIRYINSADITIPDGTHIFMFNDGIKSAQHILKSIEIINKT